jgi:hypothetical protein
MQLLFFYLFFLICTLVALAPFALSGASSGEADTDEIRKINLTESEKQP